MSYIDSYYSRTLASDFVPDELPARTETPVCIIGGGLAGISVALGLAERGTGCVLLEAERIGWGASGRNGGFLSRGFSRSALDLVRLLGVDHAKALYALTGAALERIRSRMAGHEHPVEEGRIRGAVTASWFDDEAGVRRYVEDMNRIFDENFEYWPREKVRENYLTERYYDGFLKPDTISFHPLEYVLLTAGLAKKRGAVITENARVRRVKRSGGKWQIETGRGTVLADEVVYACSGYIGSLHGRLSRATLPVATWVLLTEPLGRRLEDAIRSPYAAGDNRFSSNYYRVVGDGQLLWGGRVSMFHPSQERLKNIMLNDLLSVYPQLEGVAGEVAWAGTMGYARHKMPQIGRLANGPWYCQGFGGHGMATTTMGGELIAGAIAEGDDTYRLFEPFGLDYVGRPFGPVIAQAAYWFYQLQDAMQVSRLNRKF